MNFRFSLLLGAAMVCLFTGCEGEGVKVISVIPQTQESAPVVVQVVSEPATTDLNPPAAENEPLANIIVPAPDPEPKDITDLILVTGQSNALGGGTSYDSALDGSDKRVFAYTNNGWRVADLHQVWDRGWFPRSNPGTDPSNNFSIHFGKRLVERDANRVVGFVLVTAPGQPISHWQSDGFFFEKIRSKVSAAINELPGRAMIDGILWHQGESDGRDDDEYSDALYQLLANFRSESWFEFGRPFICGETAGLPVNIQLNKLERDQDQWTACIAAEGLPTVEDGAHFTAESLRIMGNRYAEKYYQMTR